MKWKVKTKKEKTTLEVDQLINILIPKAFDSVTEKQDFETVCKSFIEKLESTHKLSQIPPQTLGDMLFRLGYYYCSFLKSNEVEIESTHSSGKQDSSSTDIDQSLFV